jgi:pyridoxal biosynthesis lyase PdxS
VTRTSSRGGAPFLEISRRRLLGYGAASALASSAPVLAAAAPSRRLHVYDKRFAAAVASAQTAAGRGVPTRAIKGDMTGLIFAADSPWNANGRGEVSGLTTGSALQCLAMHSIIIEQARVPVLVDAGVGTASDTAVATELGCDAVLLNSAFAHAKNLLLMAQAMKAAVQAGRLSYLAGRMPRKMGADPSSPLSGLIK